MRERAELARLASAAGSAAARARAMAEPLLGLVGADAAWIARLDGRRYRSLASSHLDTGVVDFLGGPVMARDIELTGTDRLAPPLSASDLPYPAEDLRTWAECLIPSGIHEALAVALFEPGGRHVGFLAVLYSRRDPPSPVERRRLASVAELFARAIDPLASLVAASRLVAGARAGVLLVGHGGVEPLPGLPGDPLLTPDSPLIETVRARVLAGEMHLACLWPQREQPHQGGPGEHGHVRVTYLGLTDARDSGPRGLVLLSPTGPSHGLTARELEVLGMMVDGHSNSQIADRLVVTPRTVATHVEHILAKLGSPSRTHAAVHAQREGLYVPPSSVVG